MKRNSSSRIALVTLLAPVSWGTTYLTITELLPAGRPLLVAWLRVLPAGIILIGWGWWRSRWLPKRLEWLRLVVLATLNFGVFFPLLIVAIYRLPGGVAASVGGTQPLLVGLFTWVVARKAMRTIDVVVGLVAAVGVTMVVVRPGASIDPVGVFAALGANISFSAGVVATKRFPAFPDRIASTGWQLVIASILLMPLVFGIEGAPPKLTATDIVGFTYLTVITTGAAFLLWFRGIRQLPTQAPPVLGIAAPITGAILGWVVLGEDLTIIQTLGFVITIGAIAYAATLGAHQRPMNASSSVTPAIGSSTSSLLTSRPAAAHR